jgi:UDP-N-acetyl-D-glucosamine dehydrogenase
MSTDLTELHVDPLDALAAKIRERQATAAVVGLGYVGLPLLVGIHQAGFPSLGIDTDQGKIDVLTARRSHVVDVADSEIEAMDRATFSANPSPLAEADVIILCLPTPLRDGAPDLTMVLTAAEDVARYLKPGVLVVLESTTYPGTTEELLRPILEESGLVAGRDFALGYSLILTPIPRWTSTRWQHRGDGVRHPRDHGGDGCAERGPAVALRSPRS